MRSPEVPPLLKWVGPGCRRQQTEHLPAHCGNISAVAEYELSRLGCVCGGLGRPGRLHNILGFVHFLLRAMGDQQELVGF